MPNNKKVIYLIVIIALFLVATIVYFNVVGANMKEDMLKTKKAILNIEHICPEGSKESSAPWSKRGYSRFCVKGDKKNGKWVAWEKEKLAIEGYYVDDKEQGNWTWFRKDGSIYKIIEYDNGQVTSKKTFEN